MKRINCLLVLCVLLSQLSFSAYANVNAQEDSTRIVKVLTFNIYHGEMYYRDQNKPYQSNLNEIAALIKKLSPDLVAFQEVDRMTSRAKGLDLVSEIGVRTGMAPLFGKAMEYDGGEYGEGILSRYSFISTKNYSLPASDGKEPRAALSVIVEIPGGEKIRFIGTHLDHTSGEERLNQAKQLNELFSNDDIPSILVGDLNATPESETMQTLFKNWNVSSKDLAPTIPSTNPKYKIDYILYTPEKKWRVIENRVIDERKISDHNPVFTILELL